MTLLRITLAKQSPLIFLFLRRKETKEPEKSKPAQPSPAHRPRYPFHPQIILYGFFEKLPAADEPAKSLRGLFTRPAPGIDFSRSHALAHCHFSAFGIRHSAFEIPARTRHRFFKVSCSGALLTNYELILQCTNIQKGRESLHEPWARADRFLRCE